MDWIPQRLSLSKDKPRLLVDATIAIFFKFVFNFSFSIQSDVVVLGLLADPWCDYRSHMLNCVVSFP